MQEIGKAADEIYGVAYEKYVELHQNETPRIPNVRAAQKLMDAILEYLRDRYGPWSSVRVVASEASK